MILQTIQPNLKNVSNGGAVSFIVGAMTPGTILMHKQFVRAVVILAVVLPYV